MYDAILATLTDSDDAAKGLLSQVKSFSFIVILVIFAFLYQAAPWSSTKSTVWSSSFGVRNSRDTGRIQIRCFIEPFILLCTACCRVKWCSYYWVSTETSKKAPIQVGIVLECVDSRENISTGDGYKMNIYSPVLDSFLVELKERFNSQNCEIMKAIQACSPQSTSFLDPTSLIALTENYELDYSSLSMEAKLNTST